MGSVPNFFNCSRLAANGGNVPTRLKKLGTDPAPTNGAIRHNPERELIADMDDLPWVAQLAVGLELHDEACHRGREGGAFGRARNFGEGLEDRNRR